MGRASHSTAEASPPDRAPFEQASRAAGAATRRRLPASWEIPIVDAQRRIVGWTSAAPQYKGASLHHAEAERLVGGPVLCAYVQIEEPREASRAGAPPGWIGAWRCLALCSERALSPKLGRDRPTISLSPQG